MAQWITFLIFGGFGFAMLYIGATQWRLQRRLMANARPIRVQIVRSEVFASASADTDRRLNRSTSTNTYRPEIAFRYEYEGKEYQSDLLHPTIIVRGYASRKAAAEELKPYPIGARVIAYLDPDRPDKAFLTKENSAGPIVFFVIGVVLPPLAWIVGGYI